MFSGKISYYIVSALILGRERLRRRRYKSNQPFWADKKEAITAIGQKIKYIPWAVAKSTQPRSKQLDQHQRAKPAFERITSPAQHEKFCSLHINLDEVRFRIALVSPHGIDGCKVACLC